MKRQDNSIGRIVLSDSQANKIEQEITTLRADLAAAQAECDALKIALRQLLSIGKTLKERSELPERFVRNQGESIMAICHSALSAPESEEENES